MSTRETCDHCPLKVGISDTEILRVCGDPTSRCLNFRGLLAGRLKEWERLAGIAEVTKNGVLPLEFLKQGDVLQIISSAQGTPYGHQIDRNFAVEVRGMEDQVLRGAVITDTYNNPGVEPLRAQYALPLKSEVLIRGAYLGEDTISGKDRIAEGELHLGRMVSYSKDEADGWSWGLNVQEILLYDNTRGTQMHLFATDPNFYREPIQAATEIE